MNKIRINHLLDFRNSFHDIILVRMEATYYLVAPFASAEVALSKSS